MRILTTGRMLATFCAAAMCSHAATPTLSLRQLASDQIQLTWPAEAAGFELQQADALAFPAAWLAVNAVPTSAGGVFSVTLAPGAQTRFFRLRGNAPVVTTVVETSPAAGEPGVAVTRETIFRFSAPLAANQLLTGQELSAEFGGRQWLARTELSTDRRTATLFFLENLPASARVRVTLDGDRLLDADGLALDANGDGLPGGTRVLEFDTAGTAGLPGTAVVGRVFAAEKNADGSNRPLADATITVDGAEELLRTTTDASGAFTLSPAPAGRFFVHVDGRTAGGSQWPGGAYYPFVGKAWSAVAGKANNLAGGNGEIFLPLIQSDALRPVSASAETRITFSPAVVAANPALAGVEIMVPPNALFADNGTRGGMVGIAPVPPNRLPEPLPPGLNLPLVITIQTDGGSNFDVPVPVKFPNLPDPVTGLKLAPGAKSVLWSFNHDSGHWEPQGTMTISADGQFAVTDPGVGVRQPGWHGSAAGSSGGGPAGGGPPPPNCPPYCGPQPDPPCDEPDPCGNLHFLYTEAYEKWQREAELKESYSVASVVFLGKLVDEAYNKYADCREDNGWPCEGGSLSTPHQLSSRNLARASLTAEAAARVDVAIQDTIDQQNHAYSTTPLPRAGAWYALASLETGFIQRGRLNEAGSVDNLILAADERYQMSYYDAVSRQSGAAYFRSALTGQNTYIPFARLYGAEAGPQPDTDADGLSDEAEAILATAPNNPDSDGDGLKDGAEVFSGTNPLDGVALALGVVSSAPTPGEARDVDAGNGLAVLAADNGLAVFDVSNPLNPVQVAVVPGQALAVKLRGSLALAAFQGGLRLIDLSIPATPAIRWIRPDLSSRAVAFGNGASAFIVMGSDLHRVDLETGADSGSIPVSSAGDSVVARGGFVYVLGSGLTVYRDEDVLSFVGSVLAPGDDGAGGRPRRLALAGTLLYAQHTFGFNVLDLASPDVPVLLRDVTTTSAGWRHLVPTGTGLGLAAVGPNSTSDGAHDVSLYNLQPGGTNAQFITTFVTPGSGEAVAVAGGRGYVADGAAGLAVVNFLAPDLAGVPPTVALQLDSTSNPPRAESGSLVRLGALAGDDVAVKHVDFVINGEWVARDDSFPFELFHRAPQLGGGITSFTVKLRAEDLAGNGTENAETTVNLVADATPPGITKLEPPPGAVIVPAVFTEVRVTLVEPIVTPVSAATLSVIEAGSDRQFDTGDDAAVAGTVQYQGASQSLLFQAAGPLLSGKYRATLDAGLADAAGNARTQPLVWEFETGPDPRAEFIYPPSNLVRIGGTLDEITFTFDQPLPTASAATYVFEVSRRIADGPLVAVTPINVELSPDSKTFSLRTTGSFTPGSYRVFGSGPNVQALLWNFIFRDVPNEVTSTSLAAGVGLISNWKYFPGPGTGDELIVNLPGEIAPLDFRAIKSITAYTDIRFVRQLVTVEEPIQCFAGLEVANTRFGPGTTHVHGPLVLYNVFGDSFTDLLSHTIHAYGGGIFRTGIRFSDPNGALVNHPGSTLVLSNAAVANTGTAAADAGRIVNLGILSSRTEFVRLEDVRLRNDGRLEVPQGDLFVTSVENEGVMDVSAGAKLVLAQRAQGGVSSKITGAGLVEFGAYDAGRRRVTHLAEAELRGELTTTGPLTLVAGNLTLWRPLVRPDAPLTIQNGGVLHLFAPSRLGAVNVESGELVLNSDTEIASLTIPNSASIEVATLGRVTGEARLAQVSFPGLGVMEFAGLTVVSNGTQRASVGLRDGILRNTGRWLQAGAGTQGSSLAPSANSTVGFFENAGEFEQITPRPFTLQLPFRNSGRAVFGSGAVSFDSRPGFDPAHRGAYLPEPGGELVLNGTPIEHNSGVLDLAAGVVRGIGSIQAVGQNPRPRVINRAVLQPGNPAGDLTIRATDGFEQTATGELVITLASGGHSRLVLNSTAATLAGTLRVALDGDFSPNLGQTFNVLTFSSRTGEFGNVILPSLGAGKKLEVSYSPTTVTVTVVVAP